MSNKTYNIILNSVKGTKLNSTNTSISYAFDFNIIPMGEYLMTFAFTAKSNTLNAGADIALVQIDVGQNLTYAPATQFGATNSKVIGFIQPNIMGATSYLTAQYCTNPPMYVNIDRPNNTIVVNIFKADLVTVWSDSSSVDIGNYVLILNLQAIK